MRRDFDLIRKLLLEIEESEKPCQWTLSGHGTCLLDPTGYALDLMLEKSLITASQVKASIEATYYYGVAISWEGHDFLDSIRSDEIWERTKSEVGKVGSFTYDTLKALAKGLIKTQIEKHTGVALDL